MIKKYTKAVDGNSVSISCEESAERYAQILFQVLEQQNKLTPLFFEGKVCTIKVGWCYYFIGKPENAEEYTVTCPDFSKQPLQDMTDNLTTALLVQDMIVDVLGHTKTEKTKEIFFADTITVSQAVMPGRDICLQRMDTSRKGDSGWTIVVEDPTEEDRTKPMVNLLVCHILKLNPSLMGVLALPPGAKITTSNGQKELHINLKDVER